MQFLEEYWLIVKEPHRVEITSFTSILHPAWDPSTLASDIALVELPSPVESLHPNYNDNDNNNNMSHL